MKSSKGRKLIISFRWHVRQKGAGENCTELEVEQEGMHPGDEPGKRFDWKITHEVCSENVACSLGAEVYHLFIFPFLSWPLQTLKNFLACEFAERYSLISSPSFQL